MRTTLNWTEGMKFNAVSADNEITIDAKAPLGQGKGMTPKELLAVGIGGCTGMDVIALLKKHKQNYTSVEIDVEITPSTSGQPAVFTQADVFFKVTGNVEPAILLESVKLSQTKYCGVSAMLSKAFPINYFVSLNNEDIGSGRADFGS